MYYELLQPNETIDGDQYRLNINYINVDGDNFRYGLRLQLFTSVLSAELYAILRVVHYAGRSAMSRVLNLSDSIRALTYLGDCLAISLKNYLVSLIF